MVFVFIPMDFIIEAVIKNGYHCSSETYNVTCWYNLLICFQHFTNLNLDKGQFQFDLIKEKTHIKSNVINKNIDYEGVRLHSC